jgi:hypothetical protein
VKSHPHILLRALEARATLGLTVTTSKRVYYLTCQRWQIADPGGLVDISPELPDAPRGQGKPQASCPILTPRLYHVGYQLKTSSHAHVDPAPDPR